MTLLSYKNLYESINLDLRSRIDEFDGRWVRERKGEVSKVEIFITCRYDGTGKNRGTLKRT